MFKNQYDEYECEDYEVQDGMEEAIYEDVNCDGSPCGCGCSCEQSTIPYPICEPGPTGPMGPRGPRGNQGPRGLQGPQGKEGLQGLRGPQGVSGPQGIPGIQGPTGPTGVQGLQGPRGITGATGARGMQGVTGPTGPAGKDGSTNTFGAASLTSFRDKDICPGAAVMFDVSNVQSGFIIDDNYKCITVEKEGTYMVTFGALVHTMPCIGDAIALEVNCEMIVEETRIPILCDQTFVQGNAILHLQAGERIRMINDSSQDIELCDFNHTVNAYLCIYQISL